MKKLLGLVLMLAVIMSFSACNDKLTENGEGIIGTWYQYDAGGVLIHEFTEDGKYANYLEEYPDDRVFEDYLYDSETGNLILPSREGEEFSIHEKDGYIVLSEDNYDFTYDLYRSAEDAKLNSPYYLTSDEYLDSIKDEDGWCISDGVCYAYRGSEEEVTVPEGVTEIYRNAFSGDCGNGDSLKKAIVPGTVKKVDDQAFSFTNADIIVFEEGVEELGDGVFMDSYIEEVYFAASIKKIGNCILETEEGLDGTRIYVTDGSKAAEYFSEYRPYGNFEVIEE